MGIANPIKIEPKHITEYSSNIVNSNKYDHVTLTEYAVTMPSTKIADKNFAIRESTGDTMPSPQENGIPASSIDTYYKKKISENDIQPIGAVKHLDSYVGYEDWYLYYQIPISGVITNRNNIRLVFKKEIDYRYEYHTNAPKEMLLKPNSSDIIESGANSASNLQKRYIYFNTFSSVAEFESKYIQSYGNPYVLKNFKDYMFIGGIVFNGRNCTLCLFIKEFHRASLTTTYEVLTNFNIQLSVDCYKSEPVTYNYTLVNGVLTDCSTITNYNYRLKKGWTMPDNPMLTNLTVRTDLNNKKVSQVIAENILNKFKNGKQTASMTVNCEDYFDSLGAKVIGTGMERQTLQAGDYVLPYIQADIPLAKHKDGTPKKFEITSAEFEYEGRPKKHLKMVEVVE